MAAILFAFASAALLGAGAVIAQFGLRTVHPLSGAAISIPSFTLCFVLLSPLLLSGVAIDWRAVPIFAAIGLAFPAFVTLLTFASGLALGPVLTSALGNLAPLFSVVLAVLVLHEPLRPLQAVGLAISVTGALAITVTRTPQARDWRSWMLLLPLTAALLRGVIPPVIKVGLVIWPNPIAAGLTGYIFSALMVLTIERVRTGRFITKAPVEGRLWFAATGLCNGAGTLMLYAAVGAGPVTLVAPVIATYPLMTVALSAVLLTHLKLTRRLVLGTVLTVVGVMLVIAG